MRSILFPILLTFLFSQACRKVVKPDGRNGGETETAQYRPWGRIGAQTISDNYTGTPIVKKVAPSSPAEKGGLRVGDRIVSINAIDAPDLDLARYIQSRLPGTRVLFKINRGTLTLNLRITAGKFPKLDQLTLHTYENIKAEDYSRARALLKLLKKSDVKGEKSDAVTRLERMLVGKKAIPDSARTVKELQTLFRAAIKKSFDLFRAGQLLRLLKKNRSADSSEIKKLAKKLKKWTGEVK